MSNRTLRRKTLHGPKKQIKGPKRGRYREFDHVFKQGTRSSFRGITYRSRWEIYVAKLLVGAGISFKYEPQRYQLTEKISYLPDFYLPTYRVFMECKGSLSQLDMKQLYLFSKHHDLLYLGKDELEYISGRSTSFISSPDIINYVPTEDEIWRFRGLLEHPGSWRTKWN